MECSLVRLDTDELRQPQRYASEARYLCESLNYLSMFIELAPSLRKRVRRYQMIGADSPWQLDETYIKVKGKWFYLYCAINKQGQTLDFYFSKKRNRHSAY